MEILISFAIIFEILFAGFIVWGFKHEKRFVAFEDRIIRICRKKIRRVKRNLCAKWLSEEGLTVVSKEGKNANVLQQNR